MKIIMKRYHKKVEISTTTENIHEVLDEIRKALIAYGFHPDTVKEGFEGMKEENNE